MEIAKHTTLKELVDKGQRFTFYSDKATLRIAPDGVSLWIIPHTTYFWDDTQPGTILIAITDFLKIVSDGEEW